MGRLTLGALAASLLLLAAAPAAAQVERWAPEIAEASGRFGIPAAWIRRVMTAESRGRTRLAGRPIRSRAGAMGLMQLMPGTWQAMRAAYDLGADPHEPRDNILAGTAYLRLMYDRFGYPGLFAAYNAGPGAYGAFLAGRRDLPAETRSYVAQVASPLPAPGGSGPERAAARRSTDGQQSGRSVFALRAAALSPAAVGVGVPVERGTGPLFVALRTARP